MTKDEELIERAANIAYRVCAETRHVTLGDKAANAIRAELRPADRLKALAQPVVGVEIEHAIANIRNLVIDLEAMEPELVEYIRLTPQAKLVREWLAASPSPVVPRLPLMSAAFRTTVSGDGYRMDFKFPSIEALHAADDEWRAFRKDEQCTAGYAQSAAGSVPDTAAPASITTTDTPVVGDREAIADSLKHCKALILSTGREIPVADGKITLPGDLTDIERTELLGILSFFTPVVGGGWLPIEQAPRDGSYILAIVAPNDSRHLQYQAGRMFVIRHEGKTDSGFDMGWAVYPGYGGASDHNFTHFRPLPDPPAPDPNTDRAGMAQEVE